MDNRQDAAGAQGNTATQPAQATPTTVLGQETPPANATPAPEGQQTPKAEEGKKPEDAKPEAAKTEGAPEKYEFNMPEGVTLAKETLGKFEGLAKELNLSQDKAQKLVDLALDHTKNLVEDQAKQWGEIREGWVNDLKNDKEFGGDKFPETCERAKRTLRTFGSESFFSFLESTGFGDNGELIRMFAKIDKHIGEDKLVDGAYTGPKKSAADLLYN